MSGQRGQRILKIIEIQKVVKKPFNIIHNMYISMGGLQQLDNCVSHGFGEVIGLNNLYFLFSSPSIGSLLVVSSLDTVTRCWTRLGSAPIH